MSSAEQTAMPSWPRRPASSRPSTRAAADQQQLPGGRGDEGADGEERHDGPAGRPRRRRAAEHHRREGDHRRRVDRGQADQRAVGPRGVAGPAPGPAGVGRAVAAEGLQQGAHRDHDQDQGGQSR